MHFLRRHCAAGRVNAHRVGPRAFCIRMTLHRKTVVPRRPHFSAPGKPGLETSRLPVPAAVALLILIWWPAPRGLSNIASAANASRRVCCNPGRRPVPTLPRLWQLRRHSQPPRYPAVRTYCRPPSPTSVARQPSAFCVSENTPSRRCCRRQSNILLPAPVSPPPHRHCCKKTVPSSGSAGGCVGTEPPAPAACTRIFKPLQGFVWVTCFLRLRRHEIGNDRLGGCMGHDGPDQMGQGP